MAKYTSNEIMAISAGRLVKDGDILFAGTGVSLLAASAGKLINAPRAVVFFETGGIDPFLHELPLSVADPRVMVGCSINSGLAEALSLLAHPKLRTIGFVGAAQIDRFGNINSTCLGDYIKPRNRFPGAGGACDAFSLAYGMVVFMSHEKRRFVEKVDYVSSPGWLTGGDARKKAGFKRGGPIAVVTNMGVLKFDEVTKEMYLAEYYPGVTPEKIQENTGFPIDITRAVLFEAPKEEELRVLREEVDPLRLILGPPAE